MAVVTATQKAASVNPLKSSQPLGAALAFLGVAEAMPLFHGSQGCTSFALVLFVRHFKETIPLQTTAMDEVATILGGADHLEEALLNLKNRTRPKLIGVCTTALVETRGEDFWGDITLIKQKRAQELAGTDVLLVHTPEFEGAIEEGYGKAVAALVDGLVQPAAGTDAADRSASKVAILPGWHHTVADIDLIRDTVESFGLEPVIVPDISGSLDGTVPGRWIPTTYGGTPVEAIRGLGDAAHCIAIGRHVRKAAERLSAIGGVPFTVFDTLGSLEAADRFVALLATISGRPVPAKLRRGRSRLQDAMLDGHFHFGGRRVAIAAEPDHLYQLATFFGGMGAEVVAAVTTTGHSSILEAVPVETVTVGDLDDFETLAGQAGCDLLVTHSHGRQASERLGVPLMRVGFPIFDRLGSQHRRTILYDGVRDQIIEAANIFQAHQRLHTPESLDPFRDRGETHDGHSQVAHH
ncbi:nitrogenase iron-molybdenum cofactor biosynthesis protein NifN [Rhodoplanes sp. TEM]|uniref:Nitrogenase iron-molybdenum cofactor biosynthesis protein NifN n=1 Tax=Rhodoplanes tepidamans TaxID=200616 RepID=A0ABT5JFC3_RHOTP|nr:MULTISPECIES: nitrogenase iron-molybdenum cofactor biosynthesis protein NifN [Rhodoplanes]MDC7788415.1 nitrogenase iron-molybdenum cofactor biosynthesis protein NifN [Rhodoplanes tepidamans]MDC7985914.1 nitrogenase iron-molybdenum cofactor biosynthesis protein NifN [Rhodoplanes sp. TEM]MDQ0357086.1 nitrogenase molybdenum-iron protein NifN [Rhodoplanes tepidamans]